MRGDMNDRRKRLIRQAYSTLDKDGSVSTETSNYRTCSHHLFGKNHFWRLLRDLELSPLTLPLSLSLSLTLSLSHSHFLSLSLSLSVCLCVPLSLALFLSLSVSLSFSLSHCVYLSLLQSIYLSTLISAFSFFLPSIVPFSTSFLTSYPYIASAHSSALKYSHTYAQ